MNHRLRNAFVAAPVALILVGMNALAGPTFVIDFKTPGEGNTTAITGDTVGSLNYAAYGFTTASQIAALNSSVLASLNADYHGIPTHGSDPLSPIPDGKELDINFVQGSIGTAPSNGATQYYYVQLGTAVSGPNTGGGTLGVAATSSVRSSSGAVGYAGVGAIVASIFTDAINALSGLNPSNALTSGNLTFSTFAIAGTLAHEIGHTLSLSHINKAGSVNPGGLPPLMGTGAIDLPNQDRIGPRSFSYSGFNRQDGNAPVFQVQQLIDAVGLRDVPSNGVATPEPSTIVALGMGLVAGLVYRRRRAA